MIYQRDRLAYSRWQTIGKENRREKTMNLLKVITVTAILSPLATASFPRLQVISCAIVMIYGMFFGAFMGYKIKGETL